MISLDKRRAPRADGTQVFLSAGQPERTGADTAGIVAWLVMLALTVAFLAAVGASALL